MNKIHPGSENFFYWDPEELQDYQETERGEALPDGCCQVRYSGSELAACACEYGTGSEFPASIATIIRNKGVI